MPWNAHLKLDYSLASSRSVLRFAHDGPLRVLKSLYPEGDTICHNVLVHPPGGLVQGDTLDIRVNVATGAHALVSTPGATRFYTSTGEAATQRVQLTLAHDARLEWLPLETLAYPGCRAVNHLTFELAPGAELLTWDLTALGLPTAQQPFHHGQLRQHMAWPGHWLEQAVLNGTDDLLLNSPLGLAGHRCMGTLVLACGSPLGNGRRDQLLEAVREVLQAHALASTVGITAPNPHMVVLRSLSPVVEPALDLFKQVWAVLRQAAWGLPAVPPRIWSV